MKGISCGRNQRFCAYVFILDALCLDDSKNSSHGDKGKQTERQDGEMLNDVELFPAFLFKGMTPQECESLNIGACDNIAKKSGYCGGHTVIDINCNGSESELVEVSSKINL